MSDADGVLFVDLRDERLTTGLLGAVPGLTVTVTDRSRALDLARVELTGVDAAVARLREDGALTDLDGAAAPVDAAPRVDAQHAADVDALLHLVRRWGTERYGGWTPTLERDHDVGAVSTQPHIKVAATDPVRTMPAPSPQIPADAGSGPRVGVADAQVYAHPVLAGRFVGAAVTQGPFPTRASGHATFVSGLILDHAPTALLSCRAVLVHGASNRSWDVAHRLMGFADDGVDVLNMSFGCYTDGSPPLPLARAVQRLAARTVLVAAVGNDPTTNPLYPAAFGAVLAVGSSDANGDLAADAPQVPWMDVTARGEDLVGLFLVGGVQSTDEQAAGPDTRPADGAPPVVETYETGYVSWSGSSFAAAAVSGEIARLMIQLGSDAFAARDALLEGTAASTATPYRFDASAETLLAAETAT